MPHPHSVCRPLLGKFALIVTLCLLLFASSALAGTFSQQSYARTHPLALRTHRLSGGHRRPPGLDAARLHAERRRFRHQYRHERHRRHGDFYRRLPPPQPSSANSSQCWNWFETAHQSRGSGEPAYLAGLVNNVSGGYSVRRGPSLRRRLLRRSKHVGDPRQLPTPTSSEAIGVHSGLEYKAATSLINAFSRLWSSGGPSPNSQGQAAYNAMGSRALVVPVMVFHGTSDFTVATVNGNQVLSQWAQTNDLASDGTDNNDIDDVEEILQGGQVPGGRTYTRTVYEDSAGNAVMEKILVDSMGHNWSGGVLGGTFTDPDGPDASQMMIDFFFAGSGGTPDTTPPVTTASPGGGTYTSAVNVTLSVNEAATTYYTTDGSTPTTGSSVYGSPIAISADATLQFFSVDTAGNSEAVQSESYVISVGSDTTPPVTTASPAGGSYSAAVDVTLSVNEPATTYYTTDGSTPTTGSSVYSGPINLSSDATLQFFSVDASGNSETVQSESYTFTSGGSMTLTSIDGEDGFVGQLWADGSSTAVHKVGDKGMFNTDTFRLILSFDTGALPPGVTVTGATLTIYRASMSGNVQSLSVDLGSPDFGSSTALVRSDYNAAATQFGAFTLAVPSSNGASSSAALPSSSLSLVSGNRLQVRLRATAPVDFTSDVLTVHGGGAGALAPTLMVTYQ